MIWGLAFFAFLISVCCYLGIREHIATNIALRRYAQSLEKKKEQDKKPFIFVDPDDEEDLGEENTLLAENEDQETETLFW